ncbi:MAG: ABC transporter permease subunit [Planctomycetota bacterium]|nr:MAG: ABC transporter permease subunit [Planctomycetota bacterium]
MGFFCYTLGAWVDNGPTNPWPLGLWILGGAGTALLAVAAAVIGRLARPRPGRPTGARDRALSWATALVWLAALGLAVTLIAYSPFFGGFFPARTTFGTKGILWSALTLALLTLPVVVVATEEAISAVPGSLRQGSYGCGASKWQTVRRIILPSAMPGVMTGMILAIARGAGEVAPLMLVGAVKLAPELPFEPRFPYLHLERSFMHLGFHIYDVGFQSPDSEAARPVVWTTTFLLILIVVTLNLAAISLRARMRRRAGGGAF